MAYPPTPRDGSRLDALSDQELAERSAGLESQREQLLSEMAPYRERLAALDLERDRTALERRKRERMRIHDTRKSIQERAKHGDLVSLPRALAVPGLFPPSLPLADLKLALTTGGEARIGYATKPGPLHFTDGTEVIVVSTWGDAKAAFDRGLTFGTKTLPGVRVFLLDSKVEKVVREEEIVLLASP